MSKKIYKDEQEGQSHTIDEVRQWIVERVATRQFQYPSQVKIGLQIAADEVTSCCAKASMR